MRNMFGGDTEGEWKGIISEKIWCRPDFVYNRYIPLSKESVRYFYDTIRANKEIQKQELEACIDYDNNLINKKEMEERVRESSLQCFLEAKRDFKLKYDCFPIKVPVYQLSGF